MAQILTLTTDFGLTDYYVGVVKGVILSINPSIKLVDINHGIAPQDILAAAINIKKSYRFFPKVQFILWLWIRELAERDFQ